MDDAGWDNFIEASGETSTDPRDQSFRNGGQDVRGLHERSGVSNAPDYDKVGLAIVLFCTGSTFFRCLRAVVGSESTMHFLFHGRKHGLCQVFNSDGVVIGHRDSTCSEAERDRLGQPQEASSGKARSRVYTKFNSDNTSFTIVEV